ncbi:MULTISPECIES: hypothetical protein [Pseudomonas]|uniref:hypothetical protein n=1 Tax=Pseudomonas TaxID=286 RepID=UPI0018D6F4C4|nr:MULTISPECIES: hypothetical protein [Pseudomonas]MBH3471666.1 hypothetical protein [Pseudomonas putida]MDH1573693.1 hypothetical protein [Pseudomonas sp. GD03746]MDI9778012.1 hypothetical protein [Pseudomonas putida]
MTQPDRITLVLRACEAAPLSQMLPFINVGDVVSAGRGLAIIDSATEVDLKAELDKREAQLDEADELLREAIAYINDDLVNVEFRDMLLARIDKLLDRDREPQPEPQL